MICRAGGPGRDIVAAATASLLFSLALSAASVALPLAMIGAGFSDAQIGVLTAASAITQLTTRLFISRMMRAWSDWILVAGSCLLLALSAAVVTASSALLWFAVSQLVQGVARALFWTGSQTHVVRGGSSTVKALASVNLTANIGWLIGPVAAGLIAEHHVGAALAAIALLAVLAIVPTLVLDRLPPFGDPPADRPAGRIWRRPGVATGCWGGVSAGAWRALLNSYVPVALVHAGHSSTTIGILIASANVAVLAGSAVVSRSAASRLVHIFGVSIVLTGAGMAVLGLVADSTALAAAALALSGYGAGGLQTLGPAIAAEAVHPDERGDAIAATGTFRAAALFLAPFTMAAMVTALPITLAFAAVGIGMTLPAIAARGRRGEPTTT